MEQNQQIEQIGKTQFIRVIDFTLLGPGLTLFGIRKKGLTQFERFLFIATGIGTAFYNFNNWLNQKRILDEQKKINSETL